MRDLQENERARRQPEDPSTGLFRDRALHAVKIFLLLYVPFTLIQIVGFSTVPSDDIMDPGAAACSVATNLGMIAVAALFLFGNLAARRRGLETGTLFYLSLLGTTLFLTGGFIVHTHLAGSQNSFIVMLFLTTMVVVSWYLKWRHSVILLLVGNLAIVVLVFLEHAGVLPYAPLSRRSELLRSLFLDWRVILMNLLIYAAAVSIALTLLFSIRRTLFGYHDRLARANQALHKEVEERRQAEQEKQEVIERLRQALAEVKVLKGLLPICANCKKIRNDKGYWERIEFYLKTHAGAEFTHSICPDCMETLYADSLEKASGRKAKEDPQDDT